MIYEKIILAIFALMFISCAVNTGTIKPLSSKLLCKTFDQFDYVLSISDPFSNYCNTVFIPGATYIREVYEYSNGIDIERFCQDDRGRYVAVAIDEVALDALTNKEDIGICVLTKDDIIRSEIVKTVVDSYEEYDRINKTKKDNG